MVMDGLDTMSKAELVILCEKHKLDGGKTVAAMRYTLKKFFEENDEPDAKKLKTDPAAAKKAPPVDVCALGGACPNLHSLSHRNQLKHDGYRDKPIKCRDGFGCAKLHDKEHLTKYAHEDDPDRVCKDGASCSLLHVMSHRLEYEHLGFRAQPVPCRDAMGCKLLHDRGHLYKYAHVDPTPGGGASAVAPAPLAPKEVSSSSAPGGSFSFPGMAAAPAPPSPPKPAASASPSKAPSLASKAHSSASAGGAPSLATATSLASSASTASHAHAKPHVGGGGPTAEDRFAGKTMDDFPIESATPAKLTPIQKDSEEFWELEEKFNAHLQGRNEDYVEKRIKNGKKPLRFVLISVEKIENSVLEARFELKKREMIAKLGAKEARERVSFHGTHPKNIDSILKTGLLRFKHPLNPCKKQVDEGYFGTNKKGIYVSRYADYTLKYSNRVCAVDPGDEVKTVMFKTLPGKSKHIEKLVGAIDPTPGFTSHSSPTFLEWYLFDEAQCCAQYVLKVRAVEDTRTAADDE